MRQPHPFRGGIRHDQKLTADLFQMRDDAKPLYRGDGRRTTRFDSRVKGLDQRTKSWPSSRAACQDLTRIPSGAKQELGADVQDCASLPEPAMTAKRPGLNEYFVYQINVECALGAKEGEPVSERGGIGREGKRTQSLGVLCHGTDLSDLLTVSRGMTHRLDGQGVSQKELGQVQRMGHVIDPRSGRQIGDPGGRAWKGPVKDIEADESAQAARNNTSMGFADNRLEEVIVTDGQNAVMLCSRVEHPLRLRNRESHRLFDKHVTARL